MAIEPRSKCLLGRWASATALLIPILLAFALAGCGSSGSTDSTSSQSTEADVKPTNDPCTPRPEAKAVADPPKRSKEGRSNSIKLGKTKLKLTVKRTSFPSKIPVSFEDRSAFKAPKGAALVAVDYRVNNHGPDSVKPSEDINDRLLVRISGATYPNATRLPCSVPLSASWAVQHGGKSPATRVAGGKSATTSVVYIVPNQDKGTAISLVLSEQVGIALHPFS